MHRIGPNSVLPARREPLVLRTDDGLGLAGELAVPLGGPVRGCLVCVHPLPTEGGMMDSHLLRKAAWRLPALAGIAVLRFNTRGTASAAGRSEGHFEDCVGEGLDLAAAVAEVGRRGLPDPWLLGWSFGTDVILKYGLLPAVQGAVLLSPPLRYSSDEDLRAWAVDGRPLVVLVPEFDDFLPPEPAQEAFAATPFALLEPVAGAGHLWVGEKYVRLVLDRVAGTVTGDPTPLPEQWDGPAERWSDL